jgi:hypothetical protein
LLHGHQSGCFRTPIFHATEETPKLIEPIAKGEVDIAFGSRALDRS